MQKITIIKYSNTKILFITVLGQKFASHGENQHPANILLKNHPSITQWIYLEFLCNFVY